MEEKKLKNEVKKNIEALIDAGNINDAKNIMDIYKDIETDDIDVYSMEAVICIMEGKIEEAQNILLSGLAKEKTNYDLLYNLAYIYEIEENYLQAIIYYRKAKKYNYYNIDYREIERKIDELKNKLNENQKRKLSIEKVMFISINEYDEELTEIAQKLDEFGVNVDIGYAGESPQYKINLSNNPYRKMIRIDNIDDFVEYIKYYNYDSLYSKDNIQLIFKKYNLNILKDDLKCYSFDEVLDYFIENKICKYTIYKHMDVSDLTIIIPTYNRPDYLERILRYINNYKYINPKIIVLDSSLNEYKEVNKDIIRNLNNINIIYYEFLSDILVIKKLWSGIKKIKSKYLLMCADDDFITEEGIIESITRLEKNNDIYSVKGKNLYFTSCFGNLYEYDWFPGLLQSNSVERLKRITRGFFPTLQYQVFRSEKFKVMYIFLIENLSRFPHGVFEEYLWYCLVICTGKIEKINIDLNIRDKGIGQVANVKNFPDFIIDGTFNAEYKLFFDCLYRYINKIGESTENLKKDIECIFRGLLENFLQIPKEKIIVNNNEFNLEKLKEGMKESWVWHNRK